MPPTPTKYGVASSAPPSPPTPSAWTEYKSEPDVEEPQRHHPRHAGRHRVPRPHHDQRHQAGGALEKPITIARHAYGDVYKTTEIRIPGPGKAELVFTGDDGTTSARPSTNFEAPACCRASTTRITPSAALPAACFHYALDIKQDLWFSTKDTISKNYDHSFKDIFPGGVRCRVQGEV